MSEAKFKAPKEVMDELDKLRLSNYDIEFLFPAINNREILKNWVDKQPIYIPRRKVFEQALIDYVIWNKTTIELEREPHYVIYCDSVVMGHAVFYLSGGRIPVDFIESNDDDYEEDLDVIQYEEGWTKEEAERLNKTIMGKLVEVN